MQTSETTEAAVAAASEGAAVAFPSTEWFERLAALMNANRARQEQLGYVDCAAAFVVSDGGPGGAPAAWQVTFEEFEAIDVRELDDPDRADFALVATRDTWRAMIESIAAGGGRPDLEHTLNRLTHFSDPMKLVAADPLKSDLYFRYNQSLQEFFNASAGFATTFAD